MEAFVHLAVTEKSEADFLPRVGDERGRPIYFVPGRPACNLSSAVREGRRGEFWSRHGNQSENRTIRDAAGTMRARCRRFDFEAGFYAVFCFTLEHHLNYILN